MLYVNPKGVLLVMMYRSTQTQINNLPNKNRRVISLSITITLAALTFELEMLPFDNDKAFAIHKQESGKLRVKSYDIAPYTRQYKIIVQNFIGVQSRFPLKKCNHLALIHTRDKELAQLLNAKI